MDGSWSQACPFKTRLLEAAKTDADHDDLEVLLPASLRIRDEITIPRLEETRWIKKELDLTRLNQMFGYLWLAGRPMPPRPLHYQLLLGRDIMITEQMDLHLVWTGSRMFLKPLPRFLLEPQLWTQFLCCKQQCNCRGTNKQSAEIQGAECKRSLWRAANGFLFSYAALISYESDFRIAQEKNLIPPEVSWLAWRAFVRELKTEGIYGRVDPRFLYGELRLGRLSKIHRLSHLSLRGYSQAWNQYASLFETNFTLIASVVVYVAFILGAMQTGLSTSYAENDAFQAASWGFTVFSILGLVIVTVLVFLLFLAMFASNTVATLSYRKKRMRDISNHSQGVSTEP
ncbi:hypothetical protein PFICI_11313 [Pestalotiopsis fici W106-1]|uniref:Uncharacterized protein n=1 Tax=Pestalotiopsis fici (strain W106-1 / CGMCC3.15140) TaxID=1229662 RepID=W3WUF7_PESFW|nr:uncharacterized protein PFICI_11313 [Pestalotiopsis fici W106-1]ETS77439.1 hypothetical protein PFICI_11313 [Pestalotiopsis fici W106-1]